MLLLPLDLTQEAVLVSFIRWNYKKCVETFSVVVEQGGAICKLQLLVVLDTFHFYYENKLTNLTIIISNFDERRSCGEDEEAKSFFFFKKDSFDAKQSGWRSMNRDRGWLLSSNAKID